ncbi:hypothetical protein KC887_01420 [Candidatus Kaiserbacteria bacterium]|nr:hypothetical protein [Candidatus Kaiserbacteria bacterium]
MSTIDDLRKLMNKHAHEKIDVFLRAFTVDALAYMLVDYETGHDAPMYDPRYQQLLNAGIDKGGDLFIDLVGKYRQATAETQ